MDRLRNQNGTAARSVWTRGGRAIIGQGLRRRGSSSRPGRRRARPRAARAEASRRSRAARRRRRWRGVQRGRACGARAARPRGGGGGVSGRRGGGVPRACRSLHSSPRNIHVAAAASPRLVSTERRRRDRGVTATHQRKIHLKAVAPDSARPPHRNTLRLEKLGRGRLGRVALHRGAGAALVALGAEAHSR